MTQLRDSLLQSKVSESCGSTSVYNSLGNTFVIEAVNLMSFYVNRLSRKISAVLTFSRAIWSSSKLGPEVLSLTTFNQ